eukprot:1185046-Amphidinium_carterae.1
MGTTQKMSVAVLTSVLHFVERSGGVVRDLLSVRGLQTSRRSVLERSLICNKTPDRFGLEDFQGFKEVPCKPRLHFF